MAEPFAFLVKSQKRIGSEVTKSWHGQVHNVVVRAYVKEALLVRSGIHLIQPAGCSGEAAQAGPIDSSPPPWLVISFQFMNNASIEHILIIIINTNLLAAPSNPVSGSP